MRKRFIAGAVCPRCGAMDRIHVYETDGDQYKACVACDFEEKMVLVVAPGELETRVNHLADKEFAQQEAVSVVKIMGAAKDAGQQ